MQVEEISSHLRHSHALAELTDADLAKLAAVCRILPVQEGDVIVHEGDAGDQLFMIAKGEFSVFVQQAGLQVERELRRLKEGQFFGEVALLSQDAKRTASVRACTPGELISLGRQDFLSVLGQSPAMATTICRVLGQYLSAAHEAESAIPLKRLADYPRASQYRKGLPERVATFCRAIMVDQREGLAIVAMVDPHDAATRQFLTQVLHPLRTNFVGITAEDFTRALGVQGPLQGLDITSGGLAANLRFSSPTSAVEHFTSSPVDEILREVLEKALRLGATDIHFEPRRGHTTVRFRMDGNMAQAAEPLTPEEATRVTARLKIISSLDVTERRLPQDGAFVLHHGEEGWTDVRISCLPGSQGESIALRLLPGEGTGRQRLGELTTHKPLALLMRDLFLQPSGLLLVTGPTGSGKTTTVYAGLHEIHHDAPVKNIVTIEDPVDHYLDFATQTQVVETIGRTFPVILRSVLRQDPDVIVVGEIRDQESARIAIEAATTGQFVLTSLHTHFALDALPRLRVLGIEPYLLASCLAGIISQRLVPRNCLVCSQPIKEPETDEMVRELIRIGVLTPEDASSGKLASGSGCETCRQQGVRGRVALFEVLAMDHEMRAHIIADRAREDVTRSLRPGSFVSMQSYARHLLLSGVISPQHAFRAFPTSPSCMADMQP